MSEARQTVDAALREGLSASDLAVPDSLLVRAERGPRWNEVHEYRSKRYVVRSDVSQKLCYEAADELEAAYQKYSRDLRHLPQSSERFVVYLFSGQAGYLDYCGDLLGSEPHGTAGIYAPSLGQLVVWNLPERDDMIRTVRHEGLHQYVDRLMSDPPRWLNEGLAEYYEPSVLEGGRWKDGVLHEEHMELVRSPTTRWVELETFLHMSSYHFGRDMRLHYAQAWALVHFLRHERNDLFRTLFDALCEGEGHAAAVSRAFGELDLEQLERDFHRYLEELH